MDFRADEPQRMLVAVARDFLDTHCPVTRIGDLARDERGLAEDLWRSMAALGWPGLLVPAAHGGSEASLLDVVLLVEEMGRACLPGPYIASAVVATSLLVALGSREQQARVLPAMALGERRATLAIVEEHGSFAPEDIAVTLEDSGRLRGRKLFVSDADRARDLIVVGRGSGGITAVLVPADRSGVKLEPMETISGERLFAVSLADVHVGTTDVLGRPGQAWPFVERAIRVGALSRAAEIVGCAARILDLVVEHAKVRVQSGRPIGAFQAVQHAAADCLRYVDGARAILYGAAWKAAADLDAATTDVAMAKAYAADAGLLVARRAHQMFGAVGFQEEHPLHVFHKRILAGAADFGDRSAQLETVARSIGLV